MEGVILSDNRENKGAIPYLPHLLQENNKKYGKTMGFIEHQVIKNMPIGDHILMIKSKNQEGYINSAIIERKTWKDLAGSIKDNRICEQINNMKHMRDKKKCFIYFIIEGNLTYRDDVKINGIPFKNLSAKIRNLSLNGIHYFQTKNPEHTAKLLIDLTRDIIKLYKNGFCFCEEIDPVCIEYVKSTLVKQEMNDSDIVNKMWKSIKGISDKLAILAMNHFTFKEFFTEDTEKVILKLSGLKYLSNGRCIGDKSAGNIVNNSRCFDYTVKFLTSIKGISEAIAKVILDNYNFVYLFTIEIGELENITSNNRRIPKPACNRLIKLLSM